MIYRKRRDVNPYDGEPRAIACLLRTDTPYLTFADDYSTPATDRNTRMRFTMIGGDYGWLHNSSGDIRFWGSRRSAQRAAKSYRESRK